MTLDEAREIAANCYGAHPAAAALILEAIGGATLERRERSRLALRLLDPAEPLNYLLAPPEGAAWTAALSIASLLVTNVSGTRRDRQRIVGLLSALCAEAERLRELEAA